MENDFFILRLYIGFPLSLKGLQKLHEISVLFQCIGVVLWITPRYDMCREKQSTTSVWHMPCDTAYSAQILTSRPKRLCVHSISASATVIYYIISLAVWNAVSEQSHDWRPCKCPYWRRNRPNGGTPRIDKWLTGYALEVTRLMDGVWAICPRFHGCVVLLHVHRWRFKLFSSTPT